MGNKENYKYEGIGLLRAEKFKGKKKFDLYRTQYHIESLADLELLEDLVFREILQIRYKQKIEDLEEENVKASPKGLDSKQKGQIAPKSLTYALDTNLERILTLRDKLGMYEDKKQNDPFTYIEILKKKFLLWKKEVGQASRSFPCPHCQRMIILNIKTDIYDAHKHSFFKDKVLANQALWDLYKKNKINKQDVADVLGVHTDYVDWLKKKIYKE